MICTKQNKELEKFNKIEDIDIILKEQKISKDSSIAHLRINQKLFEINSKDIKIIDKIGEGGSSAMVYSAMWNNQKVAYKCFSVNEFLENKFQEFEKEVELYSSINFPFILTFYGATLNSQRLGFVIEYAENGDLKNFLEKYKKKNNRRYSTSEKIRMLYEISSAMQFLHQKSIIHRDLKMENVLVTSKEETKLMDFGLSKIVDNDLTKTKKVGTSFYIAPEVLNGKYSFECDVFSFAMLMFVLITENYSPFKNEFDICFKISKDPNLRPNLKELESKEIEKYIEIQKLQRIIKKNWNYNALERMKFKEITEFFADFMKEIRLNHNDQVKIKKVNWKEKYREEKERNLKMKEEFNKKIRKFKEEIQELKNKLKE